MRNVFSSLLDDGESFKAVKDGRRTDNNDFEDNYDNLGVPQSVSLGVFCGKYMVLSECHSEGKPRAAGGNWHLLRLLLRPDWRNASKRGA